MTRDEFIKKMEERSGGAFTDSDKAFAGSVFDNVRAMLDSEKSVSDEKLAEQIRSAMDGFKADVPDELKEQVRKACEDINKLKSTNIRSAIDKMFNLRQTLEENRSSILGAMQSGTQFPLQFRAAAIHKTTTVATSVNQTNSFSDNVQIENDIALIRYPKNFILDMISNRHVKDVPSTVILKKQKSREGTAEIVPEGGLKPLVSYTFEDKIVTRLKAAAHMEFTDEFEKDFDRLYNDILDLFERDVMRDYQDKVMNEILTNAVTYTSTALDGMIPHPDNYAAIGAAALHSEQLGFTPDGIWMHPGDFRVMQFTQDSNGNYKLPPFVVGEKKIDGINVYTSTAIDQGKFLLGESRTWREEHSSFELRFGWINEQLIHNEKTVVGEVFFILKQHDRDLGSWILGDFAAIKTALQQ